MAETYLVRAKLDGELALPGRHSLPVSFGPFRLDYSPNIDSWAAEQGLLEPDELNSLPPKDPMYPVSPLYVDTQIQADEVLEQLEAMLRLFQEGNIYLRPHEGTPFVTTRWSPPIRAEPAPEYERGEYNLGNAKLAEFIEFFNSYWDVVDQERQPLYNALRRFSSSYETRTSADRLVELMIAMNALFGSKDKDRFNIARKSACMIYPAGEAREMAFDTIKRLYDQRSAIVHGRSLDPESDSEQISRFEDYVRMSITIFLKLYKDGHLHVLQLKGFRREFDQWFFFAKCLKCRPSL